MLGEDTRDSPVHERAWPVFAEQARRRSQLAPTPRVHRGQVLARNVFMSVDPYMRGGMNAKRSYAPLYEVDQVLYG